MRISFCSVQDAFNEIHNCKLKPQRNALPRLRIACWVSVVGQAFCGWQCVICSVRWRVDPVREHQQTSHPFNQQRPFTMCSRGNHLDVENHIRQSSWISTAIIAIISSGTAFQCAVFHAPSFVGVGGYRFLMQKIDPSCDTQPHIDWWRADSITTRITTKISQSGRLTRPKVDSHLSQRIDQQGPVLARGHDGCVLTGAPVELWVLPRHAQSASAKSPTTGTRRGLYRQACSPRILTRV